MPRLALAILVLYVLLVFGLRSWIQWRRTGSTGFRGISGPPGSAEWFGGLLFVIALVAAFMAPVAQLAGWVEPHHAINGRPVHFVGLVLALAGVGATLWSQLAMGESWRIGVEEGETTRLIVHGPFRWVRNPIFTSMALGFAGLFLLTPNVLAAAGVVALIVALQLQVRVVEEPYLVRSHGARYSGYAADTGRFLPGIGRLR